MKVFRTRIGMHDWLVAVPSQKAALAAWDVKENLFAQGAAKVETDPKLVKLALASPGNPVPIDNTTDLKKALAEARKAASKAPAKPAKKRAKPPDRVKVEKAEEALAAHRRRIIRERSEILRKQKELDERLDALEAEHNAEEKRLKSALQDARTAYDEALEAAAD